MVFSFLLGPTGLPPVVALEIGTSKTVALVGEVREDGHLVITGLGEHASVGVRKGEVVDFDQALVCVRAALAAAEETGQVAIHQVHLALSGNHIQTLVNRGTFPILHAAAGITPEDVQQVTAVARAVNLPPDRQVLHSIGQTFYVDGERVARPEDFEGAKLALDMLILHTKRGQVRNAVKLVQSLPVEVADVAFSGLCSALAVLTPEQKEGGVIVVDMGAGVTDYVAYAAGMFAAAGAIGLGGDHLTNDLALAFRIPRAQAERLKREYGCSPSDAGHGGRVNLPPEVGYPARSINLRSLHVVLQLRLKEIFQIVRSRIEEAGLLRQIGAGIVLTGGGAGIKGARELAEEVFGAPCVVGRPIGFSGLASVTDGPQYATAAGLLRYAVKTEADSKRKTGGGLVRRLFGN